MDGHSVVCSVITITIPSVNVAHSSWLVVMRGLGLLLRLKNRSKFQDIAELESEFSYGKLTHGMAKSCLYS